VLTVIDIKTLLLPDVLTLSLLWMGLLPTGTDLPKLFSLVMLT